MRCPHCNRQINEFRGPRLTVDIIIELKDGIVLIERRNEPRGWALPGGFVDYGESLAEAAVREAYEETGLVVKLAGQLGSYSEPGRDPRQHTVTTVFMATAAGLPEAGDDAGQAAVFTRDRLPALVFDHALILADYFLYKKAHV